MAKSDSLFAVFLLGLTAIELTLIQGDKSTVPAGCSLFDLPGFFNRPTFFIAASFYDTAQGIAKLTFSACHNLNSTLKPLLFAIL